MSKDVPERQKLVEVLVSQEKSIAANQRNQEEIKKMADREKNRFHLSKWSNLPIFVLVLLLGIVFVASTGLHSWGLPPVLLLMVGLVFMIAVGILLGLSIIQVRTELMKEMKQLQVQFMELSEKLTQRR